ncbi:MAG TPA: glutamine synthetase family protein [Crinalium sp.]|jgi:glutamine synthetase
MVAIREFTPPVVLGAPLPDDIRQLIETGSVEFVRFEVPDTHGIARSKVVPVSHFERFSKRGLNFPLPVFGLDVQGAVAPNTGYLEEIGFGDGFLFPDFNTFQVLPWLTKTARVIGDPYRLEGHPAKAAPRLVLQPLLEELEDLGYRLLSGYEYEFYLVDAVTLKPSYEGIQLFAAFPDGDRDVLYNILRSLPKVGVDIITADLEYGPGQVEINFAPAWGIAGADQAYTFKNSVKEIAQQSGKIASFMTKPQIDASANGCHFNQSLWDGDRNAFFDPDRENGLSDVCLHYIAGQLTHAPAMMALLAPTVNCWKRFKPDTFAPTNATWGIDNRTTGIRVKALKDERTYMENRLGTGAANPYLVMAATLAAGLDGIKRRLEPPRPIQTIADRLTDVPPLPKTLDEALDALEADTIMRDALGEEFIKLFVALKRYEIEKAKQAMSDYGTLDFLERIEDWERQEFFSVL